MSVPSGTKFIGISANVDTLERKSVQANSPSQVYTVEDLSDTIKPYKVYTALLTQSGGDGVSTILGDETIQKGISYYISDNLDNEDLTLVGAPNNNPGTYFVATQTVTGAYTLNVALTFNPGAPVVTVLENTVGNVYFTYSEQGVYRIKLPQFDITKTYYSNGFGNKNHISVSNDRIIMSANPDHETFDINTFEGDPPADFILYDTPIEIRVYN